MTIHEYFKKTNDKTVRPAIFCKDGFNMSVQGSKFHYCMPRVDGDKFSKMEIGFPSKKEKLIMDYAESPDNPTGTVYGYVPVKIIEQVIEKHGGIDIEKTEQHAKDTGQFN